MGERAIRSAHSRSLVEISRRAGKARAFVRMLLTPRILRICSVTRMAPLTTSRDELCQLPRDVTGATAPSVCPHKTSSRLVARGVLLFTEQIRFVRGVRMIRNQAVAVGPND